MSKVVKDKGAKTKVAKEKPVKHAVAKEKPVKHAVAKEKVAKEAPSKKKSAKSIDSKDTVRLGQERLYKVITSPVVTEKSTRGSEQNKVTLTVALDATKPEIKKAVEVIFKVQVTAVNTLRLKGKTKRFKGILGRRADRKKAIVTLAEGHSIDIASGL